MVQRLVDILEYPRGADSDALEVSFLEVYYDSLENPDSVLRPEFLDPVDIELHPQYLDAGDSRPGLLLVGEVDPSTSDTVFSSEIQGGRDFNLEFAGGLALLSSDFNPPASPIVYSGGGVPTFTPSGIVQGSIQTNNPGVEILQAADDPAFQATSNLSVSFWMLPDSRRTQIPLVGKGISSAGEAGWNIGMSWNLGSSGQFWCESEQAGNGQMGNTNYIQWNANDSFVAGSWDHHLFTLDFVTGTYTYYKNSVPLGNPSAVFGSPQTIRHDNTQPLSIFGDSGFYSTFSYSNTINMFDLSIYLNQVLTSSDATALYNGGSPLPPVNASTSVPPSIYYPMRNLSSLSLTDLMGNAPPLVNSGCVASPLFP